LRQPGFRPRQPCPGARRLRIRLFCRRTNLSRNQAYMLCSLIGDLRVTQTVDGNKGVHMLLAKQYLY
jgi:acetamidase/formamidase